MNNTQSYSYLVVEDESLIRKNLIKKISALNLPLELYGEASNGMDAIVLIEKNCPDLVITDIRMPQCDGIEVIRHIHKNHPHVKTLILSGFDDFTYAQSALRYGAHDYLLKPVTVEALYETLNNVLVTLDAEHKKCQEFKPDVNKLDQKSICSLLEKYLRENYRQEISFNELSEKFGFTPEYLGKIFKKHMGEPPSKYLIKLRMNEAKHLLVNHPDLEIQKVGEMVGYKDGFYFSRAFKSYTGVQPSEFRNH